MRVKTDNVSSSMAARLEELLARLACDATELRIGLVKVKLSIRELGDSESVKVEAYPGESHLIH